MTKLKFIIMNHNWTTGSGSNSGRCKCLCGNARNMPHCWQGLPRDFQPLPTGGKSAIIPTQDTEPVFVLHIICKQNNPVCPRPARSGGSEIRCHYQVLLLCGHKVVPSERPASCRQMRRIIWFHLWKCQTLWVNKIHSIFFCLSILGENRLEIAYKWGVLRIRQYICYPLQMHSTATATSVLCERTT